MASLGWKGLNTQEELTFVSATASYFNSKIYQAFSQELLTFME
jgi:hypothetical protein